MTTTTFNFTQAWQALTAETMLLGGTAPNASLFWLCASTDGTLTEASSMAAFVANELLPVNGGYSRQQIVFQAGGINATNNRYEVPTVSGTITAAGGNLTFQTFFIIANGSPTASVAFTSSDVNASTNTISFANTYSNGDNLVFTCDSSSSLPGGLSNSTIYQVSNVTSSSFQLESGGNAVDITSAGSGNLYAHSANGTVMAYGVASSAITLASGQSTTIQIPIIFANVGDVNGV